MVAENLDKIFAALADSTRRAILAKLATGGASVSELAKPFKMTQPAISKHLKVLQDANLISSEIEGQRRLKNLNPETLAKAVAWIDHYQEICERNYVKLDALLNDLQAAPKKPKSVRKSNFKKPKSRGDNGK